MNNAFQKLQRKVSPAEVEKLRKLNTAFDQCRTDIRNRGWSYIKTNQLAFNCLTYSIIIKIKIKGVEQYEEYFGGFGGMSGDYDSPNKFEKSLLNGDRPCDVFNYFLFYTPFTIDDLLSVNEIHAQLKLIVGVTKIDLNEPLPCIVDL